MNKGRLLVRPPRPIKVDSDYGIGPTKY